MQFNGSGGASALVEKRNLNMQFRRTGASIKVQYNILMFSYFEFTRSPIHLEKQTNYGRLDCHKHWAVCPPAHDKIRLWHTYKHCVHKTVQAQIEHILRCRKLKCYKERIRNKTIAISGKFRLVGKCC